MLINYLSLLITAPYLAFSYLLTFWINFQLLLIIWSTSFYHIYPKFLDTLKLTLTKP